MFETIGLNRRSYRIITAEGFALKNLKENISADKCAETDRRSIK